MDVSKGKSQRQPVPISAGSGMMWSVRLAWFFFFLMALSHGELEASSCYPGLSIKHLDHPVIP